MNLQEIRGVSKRNLLIDIDTQRDFFLANGKSVVRNHRRVLINIRRIFAWARLHRINIISTHLSMTPPSFGPMAENTPCTEGTEGMRKISYTITPNLLVLPQGLEAGLRQDIFEGRQQVVIITRNHDVFEESIADKLLSGPLPPMIFVIGAPLESVLPTVLGLLARRKSVTVLTDAIGYHDRAKAEMALRSMEAKGAALVNSADLIGRSRFPLVNACECDRCRGKFTKNRDETIPEAISA